MPARRYTIVCVDTHGRPIRRLRLGPWQLCALAGVAAAALAGAVAGIVGLVGLTPPAASGGPPLPLAVFAGRVAALEDRWLPLADQAGRNEAAFAQVWARSASAQDPRGRPEAAGSGPRPQPMAAGGDRERPFPLAAAPGDGPRATAGGAATLGRRLATVGDDGLLADSEARLATLEARGQALFASLMQTLDHFHDAAQRVASTPSIRPSMSPWLSSSYGRRLDPISQRWMMHKGLDLAGSIGMPIFAPADGKIIWTGWRGGYGKTVVIDHGYGLQTHFAHLDAYQVDAGERVRRGDIIARMGNSGRSTGPHLHYEVRRDGQPLDPRLFILD